MGQIIINYLRQPPNLIKRIYEHREGLVHGFTRQYGLKRLVYYEMHETIEDAATRERQLKKWQRSWKIRLIQELNPQWDDLYEHLF